MKNISLIFLLVGLSITAKAQSQVASAIHPVVELQTVSHLINWDHTSFDFGKVPLNTPAIHEFTFINRGSTPLLISDVQASCGCTVVGYTKEPIASGSAGFVKATYDAKRIGVFSKTITVNTNTEGGAAKLRIIGEVVEYSRD